jgi:hypothetical protein
MVEENDHVPGQLLIMKKITYTGWRKKKLTCLIYFNLKTKRAITPKLRALHSVLSNLNFDIRHVQFSAILTERAAFKLE